MLGVAISPAARGVLGAATPVRGMEVPASPATRGGVVTAASTLVRDVLAECLAMLKAVEACAEEVATQSTSNDNRTGSAGRGGSSTGAGAGAGAGAGGDDKGDEDLWASMDALLHLHTANVTTANAAIVTALVARCVEDVQARLLAVVGALERYFTAVAGHLRCVHSAPQRARTPCHALHSFCAVCDSLRAPYDCTWLCHQPLCSQRRA